MYAGCSWWNAKGPRTIASTGATCVCVRHRGAFPAVDVKVVLVLSGVAAFCANCNGGTLSLVQQMFASLACAVTLFSGWYLTALNSANFDNMLEDVATAIAYTRNHEDISTSNVILGGYSSGGHVLTSLLSRPDVLKAHELPSVEDNLCDGVLLLSGVLGTSPPGTSSKPRWFTDFVVKSVWGSSSDTIPSPVHTMLDCKAGTKKKLPPHLLVGCGSETFGIPLLDTFFCRDEYAAAVTRAGGKADKITVDANHWTVLDCDDLFNKLGGKFLDGWPMKLK